MIKRIWHGYTTFEKADAYETFLREQVASEIESKNIDGLLGFEVSRRSLAEEEEFIVVMQFSSEDNIKALTGEDCEQAYIPDEARKLLSRFDERAQHYEVKVSNQYK